MVKQIFERAINKYLAWYKCKMAFLDDRAIWDLQVIKGSKNNSNCRALEWEMEKMSCYLAEKTSWQNLSLFPSPHCKIYFVFQLSYTRAHPSI